MLNKKVVAALPGDYGLAQNYPNPFNPTTTIHFELPEVTNVHLVVYDVGGREVCRIVDETLNAGYHEVNWNAEGMPSGVYLYQLRTGEYLESRRMLLTK